MRKEGLGFGEGRTARGQRAEEKIQKYQWQEGVDYANSEKVEGGRNLWQSW